MHPNASTRSFYIQRDVSREVGHLDLFDEPLVDGGNMAVNLRSPWSLAYLLEAAGPLCLERCGAILDRWVSEEAGR